MERREHVQSRGVSGHMIIVHSGAELSDFAYCAKHICPEESQAYEQITGNTWLRDDVAARLWLARDVIWTFWETVGNFPVAVGGYGALDEGRTRFSSWFMSTPDAWRRGDQITKAVAACVQWMLQQPQAARLETVTLATREKARAWYGQIGLTYDPASNSRANGHELVTYVAVRP